MSVIIAYHSCFFFAFLVILLAKRVNWNDFRLVHAIRVSSSMLTTSKRVAIVNKCLPKRIKLNIYLHFEFKCCISLHFSAAFVLVSCVLVPIHGCLFHRPTSIQSRDLCTSAHISFVSNIFVGFLFVRSSSKFVFLCLVNSNKKRHRFQSLAARRIGKWPFYSVYRI